MTLTKDLNMADGSGSGWFTGSGEARVIRYRSDEERVSPPVGAPLVQTHWEDSGGPDRHGGGTAH